jgi:hypothetical protein
MSVDRSRIAGWLAGVAGAGGAGIAMLVCCTTSTAAAGGGLAAAGGVLCSPWLIVAGVIVIAFAVAALIAQRTRRRVGDDPLLPAVGGRHATGRAEADQPLMNLRTRPAALAGAMSCCAT